MEIHPSFVKLPVQQNEVLVATVLVAGIIAGTVTGLLPGLHPNAVVFILLSLYFFLDVDPMLFVAFCSGVGTVHTFVSFIPTIFLGAPEEETALSVLPGHRFVHQGRGVEALHLTVYGGIISSLLAVAALPVLIGLIPPLYGWITDYIHIILMLFLAYIVLEEKNELRAVLLVVVSALIGIAALNSPLSNSQYIFFAMFAGFFGISTVVLSILQGATPPEQQENVDVALSDALSGGLAGFGGGCVAGFLPGTGPSQIAVLAERVNGMGMKDFMVFIGGITTADMFISLLALYVIGNPRSGVAVAVQQVVGEITLYETVQVIGMCMIGIGAGALITLFIGPKIVYITDRTGYTGMRYGVVGFVVVGSVVLNGWFGLLTLVTATATGLLATCWDVRRSNCMAALIVPAIFHYLGVSLPPL